MSACAEKVVIYDYLSQQEYRELKFKGVTMVCFGADPLLGLLIGTNSDVVLVDLHSTKVKKNFMWNKTVSHHATMS